MKHLRLNPLQRNNIKLPPANDETTVLRWVGPAAVPGAATVYMWADFVTELLYAALQRPDVMQTALLVGGVFAGPGEVFVEARGYIDLERFDDIHEFARTTNEHWTLTLNRLQRRDEALGVVGWAVLREGLGDPPSRDLQLAHRSFFNLPHQLLLSVDPKTQQLALYGFDEIGRLVQIGFQLVSQRPGVDASATDYPEHRPLRPS